MKIFELLFFLQKDESLFNVYILSLILDIATFCKRATFRRISFEFALLPCLQNEHGIYLYTFFELEVYLPKVNNSRKNVEQHKHINAT